MLVFAAIGGSTALGRVLINLGADVDDQSLSDQGWNPILKASECRSHDFMRLLIERGASVNVRTNDGKTALMLAAEEDQSTAPGDRETVEILLNAGADPNVSDRSGWTALMYAAKCGGTDVARTLLKHGADLTARNDKQQTALVIALESSQPDVAEVLGNFEAKK